MTVSRDLIQGFIDGYITSGGDPSSIDFAVSQYLAKHPTYPQPLDAIGQISSDLTTYRVTPQLVLAPTPVTLVPTPPIQVVP